MYKKTVYCLLILGIIWSLGTSSSKAMIITSSSTQEKPIINFTFDTKKVYPGDFISSTPKIEITILSSNEISSGKIKIGNIADSLFFTNHLSTYEVRSPLPDGNYCLTIEASDNFGNTSTIEVSPLYVQMAKDLIIQGNTLSYPNPFNPSAGGKVYLGYILTRHASVVIKVFDIAGNLVKQISCASNQEGGRAGYNEVSWDGKADNGGEVGNGVYLYLIIAEGKVIPNGKGKITIFKQ